ncbi:MAG: hypothetical protein ACPGXK_00080 [Phycisphaerae bacterium]
MNIIEKIKQLDQAATPGPWHCLDVAGNPWLGIADYYDSAAVFGGINEADKLSDEQTMRNGKAAASYRNLAPKAAELLERAKDLFHLRIEQCPCCDGLSESDCFRGGGCGCTLERELLREIEAEIG